MAPSLATSRDRPKLATVASGHIEEQGDADIVLELSDTTMCLMDITSSSNIKLGCTKECCT